MSRSFVINEIVSKQKGIKKLFYDDTNVLRKDHYLFTHLNGVCVVGITPFHAVFQEGGSITKICFLVGLDKDNQEVKLSGKRKHGAQTLKERTKIAEVHCSNGAIYPIFACVSGKLLEINTKLTSLENPDLFLREKWDCDGYFAFILPSQSKQEVTSNGIQLTEEQYFTKKFENARSFDSQPAIKKQRTCFS
eukprot:GCRY01003185.1.p1 GENE.GCRY01003185.1~~GCRY01003185.1.p1  ORF type:complete len:192 (+),score=14.45 GCRY01003185.1:304-879(+)